MSDLVEARKKKPGYGERTGGTPMAKGERGTETTYGEQESERGRATTRETLKLPEVGEEPPPPNESLPEKIARQKREKAAREAKKEGQKKGLEKVD